MNLSASAETSADSVTQKQQENSNLINFSSECKLSEHSNNNTNNNKSSGTISKDGYCTDHVQRNAQEHRWYSNWEQQQQEQEEEIDQPYEFQQSPIAVQLGLSEADLTMMRSIGCQARCNVHKEGKEHTTKERELCEAALHSHHHNNHHHYHSLNEHREEKEQYNEEQSTKIAKTTSQETEEKSKKEKNKCSQSDLYYSRCQHWNVELSIPPPFYPSSSSSSSSSSLAVTNNPKHRTSFVWHYNKENSNTHSYNSCSGNSEEPVAPFSDSELDEPIVRPLMCDVCARMQRNKSNASSISSKLSSHSLALAASTPTIKVKRAECILPDIRTSTSSMKASAATDKEEEEETEKNKETTISQCVQESSSHLEMCQTSSFANISSPVSAQGENETPFQASFRTWRFPFLGRNDKSLLITPAEGVLARSTKRVDKEEFQVYEEEEYQEHEQRVEQKHFNNDNHHRHSNQISSPCSFFSSFSSRTSSSTTNKGNKSRLPSIPGKFIKSNSSSKSIHKQRQSTVVIDDSNGDGGDGVAQKETSEQLYMPHRTNRGSSSSMCSNASCVTVYISASAHHNVETTNISSTKPELMHTDSNVEEVQPLAQSTKVDSTNSTTTSRKTKLLTNTATISYDEDEVEREYERLLHMVYAFYLRNRQDKTSHRKREHQLKQELEEEQLPENGKWVKIITSKVKPQLSSPQTVPTLALCHSPNSSDGKKRYKSNAQRQEHLSREEHIAHSLTASTLLNRSASYYTRATHNGPIQTNRQSSLTLPQSLRVLSFSSFASLPTRALMMTMIHKNSLSYPHAECGSAHSSFSIQSRAPSINTSFFSPLRRQKLDQSILNKIEQRPLLQLTVFVKRLFTRLTANTVEVESSKQQQEQELYEELEKECNVDTCVNEYTHQETKIVECKTEQINAHTEETERIVTNDKWDVSNENRKGNNWEGESEHEALISPISQPCSTTESNLTRSIRYRRMLTPMERLVRHRHMLDGIEREVDNEKLDLVVYVGMRLMGWLEVVSLLGAGSFGQVFLCKDLRICDGHFVNPNEMQGEDFVYWNCSHEYLPFGNSNNIPRHSPLVAVKVVKSVPLFEQQSVMEAEMLVLIGSQTAEAPAAMTTMTANTVTSDCSNNCGKTWKVSKRDNDTNSENVSITAPNEPQHIHDKENDRNDDVKAKEIEETGKTNSKDDANQLSQALKTEEENEQKMKTSDDEEHPPESDPRCGHVAKVLADGVCYGHHCIVMERYGANLFEYIQHRSYHGLPLGEVQSIGKQLFSALSLLHNQCHIVHADIKPENLLLTMNSCTSMQDNDVLLDDNTLDNKHNHGSKKEIFEHHSYIPLMRGCDNTCNEAQSVENGCEMITPSPLRVHVIEQSANADNTHSEYKVYKENKEKNTCSVTRTRTRKRKTILNIKLIDFSSSCYENEACFSYIQSRYYRAPEVIVGVSYGTPIDIWSTGCVLAELFLGVPLLAGVNDHHQLMLIEEMIGPLPHSLLSQGANTKWYYNLSKSEENQQLVALWQSCKENSIHKAITTHEVNAQEEQSFKLYSREEYLRRRKLQEIEYTRYFVHNSLHELIRRCPLSKEERSLCHTRAPSSINVSNSGDESCNSPKYKGQISKKAGICNNDNNLTDNYRDSKSKKENNSVNNKKITHMSSIRKEIMHQRFLFFDLLRSLLKTDPSQRPTATRALEHAFFKAKFNNAHNYR